MYDRIKSQDINTENERFMPWTKTLRDVGPSESLPEALVLTLQLVLVLFSLQEDFGIFLNLLNFKVSRL